MLSKPPANIGVPLVDIDTPALVIDLDAFEHNLDTMASAANEFGVRLRPHAKTHKSPIVAAKQIARGAVGVCCQKVSEAEALVSGGITDVLVTNQIAGNGKAMRLAALARHAKIGVCVDNARGVEALAAATVAARSQIPVLVEIDVGAARCGVAPGQAAVDLASEIARHRGLKFAGLQAYYGSAQHLRLPQERYEAIDKAKAATGETVRLLSDAGFHCEIIGGAGTGTFPLEGRSGVWNEIQPGSYIFMDADYAKNQRDPGASVEFKHALFVLATVMSVSEGRAVVDAGHKALSNDSGFPVVWGDSGIRYHRPSDEHGILDFSGAATRAVWGQKLLLVPSHCDPTVNLYDWYVGVRHFGHPDAYVEAVWPIAARGAVT